MSIYLVTNVRAQFLCKHFPLAVMCANMIFVEHAPGPLIELAAADNDDTRCTQVAMFHLLPQLGTTLSFTGFSCVRLFSVLVYGSSHISLPPKPEKYAAVLKGPEFRWLFFIITCSLKTLCGRYLRWRPRWMLCTIDAVISHNSLPILGYIKMYHN